MFALKTVVCPVVLHCVVLSLLQVCYHLLFSDLQGLFGERFSFNTVQV